MTSGTIIKLPAHKGVFAVPKEYEVLLEERGAGHYMNGSLAEDGAMRQGILTDSYRWSAGTFFMTVVHCKEHDRMELVHAQMLRMDLDAWYHVGLHPRFSIWKALREEGGQILWQTRNIIRSLRVGPPGERDETDGTAAAARKVGLELQKALKASRSPKTFIRKIRPHLYVRIRAHGRRLWVRQSFADRFKKRDFTVEDFFNEGNQELRRIILRFVPIQEVLKRMKLISEDAEGKIYDVNADAWNARRYLFVTCPSTAQEYLLEIPRRVQSGKMVKNNWGGETPELKDLTIPAEARRWTFNLPLDAEFVKEA